MSVIALIIALDSPGDPIFRQERLGKDGKPFTMYKFRSMYEDAERDGPRWAAADDGRCSNRLAVTPGLTGYAQVNGGYDLKPEEKIVYDMEYIEHRSVWMDLLCILKTIRVVFCGDGAR